ncbi:phytanoyl-CoA dioxygenase [Paenibacillus selenitireducens]|uniref:Phytanoyl-CoA dioxygenase n=1 Tax=Paenibacillus selenitireducens TaxID=1324314 RepID=A0A1T2X1U4_9BACL|nr:HEAT repeat domain-containing protein [Paenibacillus selenitireducens]OPA73795.1 phytanoyl-CoA dioxygenase [Paenibacillus selenitireducens]
MLDRKNLLTDEQMMQFITKGYLVLQNDLPTQLHQDTMDQIYHVLHEEGNPGNNILPRVPSIMEFFDTPVVKGALTSVLGPDYYMHPHRHCHYNQPGNQLPGGGQWHKDGYWSSMRNHRPWWAMIFYYTQDITEDMGPTAIMPGTQYYEKFIGDRGETLLPTGKAGTMVLVHFDLWHKASLNVSDLDRYMLKFQFVRLRAPEYPSWNHQSQEMVVPAGTPSVHLNLWKDVWDWLRGERTLCQDNSPVDDAKLSELKQGLLSDKESVRAQAADELGLLGETGDSLVPALGLLLNDIETTALNAAYALGHMGTKGVEELLEHLTKGTTQVAERAAYGLQGTSTHAIPGLLQVLEHADEKRRALAAFVLGMIGSAENDAVPALIVRLQDESDWVRRNAIEALGMIGNVGGEAVPALSRALVDSLCDETDDQTKSNDMYENMQSYITNKLGYTAALSLLRIGKEGDALQVVRSLEKALNSKDRYVRAYASEALTHLRTAEAVDALIRYYRTSRWCPDTSKASTF